MKKIKTLYRNILLCIKYPFLYPRNRFTGTHYTNWRIREKINQLEEKYNLRIHPVILTYEEFERRLAKNRPDGKLPVCAIVNLFNKNNKRIYAYKLYKYIGFSIDEKESAGLFPIKNYVQGEGIAEAINHLWLHDEIKNGIVRTELWFVLKPKYSKEGFKLTFRTITICLSKILKLKVNLLQCLERLLACFHIIPSFTELDAMPTGWRKAFGENICKEIRDSLLTTYKIKEQPKTLFEKIRCSYKGLKLLFSYRIMQIKEKYGQLRWYDSRSTDNIFEIIEKYTEISEKTCIVCGERATYLSLDWICPFCSKHKPENSKRLR